MTTEIFINNYRRKQCVQWLLQRTSLSRAVLGTLKIVSIELMQILFKLVGNLHFERVWIEVTGVDYWITGPERKIRMEKDMFLMREERDAWKAAPEHQSIQGRWLAFKEWESNRSEGMEQGNSRSRAQSRCFSGDGKVLLWPAWGLVGSFTSPFP